MEIKTTLRPEVLAKYPNDMFVETGTFDGSGCMVALQVGFKRIVSFEISVKKFMLCCGRFKDYPQVDLVLGDTMVLLPKLLDTIYWPCTFWLDAHMPEDGTQHSKDWSSCPIMHEFAAIKKHHIKTHTIMIDDLNHFRSGVFDHFSEQDLKDALLRINPDYRFVYEDGAGHETVLVAIPTTNRAADLKQE
jgi:hypothetical protein